MTPPSHLAIAPITDWHAHWIPPEIAALFEQRSEPPMIRTENGDRFFYISLAEKLPLKERQLDIDARLADMDAAGLDRQILSFAVLYGFGLDRLPAGFEADIVSANNLGLSRLIQKKKMRFGGFALLPIRDLRNAPDILKRAMEEQGLIGAVLPAEAFSSKAAAHRYQDIFRAASRLRAHLFIHPGAWTTEEPAMDDAAIIRRRAIRFQNDLTAAAVTFEYTDFLDPFPDLRLHLANLGGTLAFLAERIAYSAERMGLGQDQSDGKLRRIFVDSGSFGPNGIRLAVENLGGGRIILGSDCPALPLGPALSAVRSAKIDETKKNRILRSDEIIAL